MLKTPGGLGTFRGNLYSYGSIYAGGQMMKWGGAASKAGNYFNLISHAAELNAAIDGGDIAAEDEALAQMAGDAMQLTIPVPVVSDVLGAITTMSNQEAIPYLRATGWYAEGANQIGMGLGGQPVYVPPVTLRQASGQ